MPGMGLGFGRGEWSVCVCGGGGVYSFLQRNNLIISFQENYILCAFEVEIQIDKTPNPTSSATKNTVKQQLQIRQDIQISWSEKSQPD